MKAGVEDAPKAPPVAGVDIPNCGVVVLLKARVDWASKVGVVDPKAWLPLNAGWDCPKVSDPNGFC